MLFRPFSSGQHRLSAFWRASSDWFSCQISPPSACLTTLLSTTPLFLITLMKWRKVSSLSRVRWPSIRKRPLRQRSTKISTVSQSSTREKRPSTPSLLNTLSPWGINSSDLLKFKDRKNQKNSPNNKTPVPSTKALIMVSSRAYKPSTYYSSWC